MSNIVLAKLGENIKASTAGQVATSSGSTTAPALVNNTFSFRNKIINGNFDVWQRGTSFSNPSHLDYTSDRWQVSFDGTGGSRSISRLAFTVGQTEVPNNPTYLLRWNQVTATTGGTYVGIKQNIENVRTFSGQQVVVSFYAKAAVAGSSIYVTIGQRFGTGGSATVLKNSSSDTLTTQWKKYTFTLTLDSIAGKTIGTDDFVDVGIIFPSNTTYIIDIAQVQIEEGSFATAFEQRPIGTELALCQRYYQFYDGDISLAGTTTTGSGLLVTTLLPVKMRQAPVISAVSFVSSQAQGVSITAAGANDRFFLAGRTNTVFPAGGSYGVFSFAYNDVSFNAEL